VIPAIYSYSYHRYFGILYPELETDPGSRMTIEDVIDRAAEMGAGGVALDSHFVPGLDPGHLDDLAARMDAKDLARDWAWGFTRGLESGKNPDALKDLIAHLPIARRLGAKVMRICAGGRATRPERWEDHRSAILPLLDSAARAAADAGITLAVENHIDLNTEQMLEVLERVDNPALGVCLDTANNLRLFEDPVEATRQLAPFTRTTHVKDITAQRGDPKTFAFWPSVPAGRGLVDLAAIVALLDKAGYTGLLALETDYLHPDHGSVDAAMVEGLAHLTNLLNG
jgi:sugar phosphate isomerase/epimerase